jgi:hypothetical protein
MAIGFHLDDIEEAYFKNNMTDDKPIGGLFNCNMPVPQGFGKQEGWICPVCGRGLAPWVSFCPCQSDWKITYGTSTGVSCEPDEDTRKWINEQRDKFEKILLHEGEFME